MNERQARRAVMLADERQAILHDLEILTDENRGLGEGIGLIIVTTGMSQIGAEVSGASVTDVINRWGRQLRAHIPRPAFNAALQAMVTASQDRVLAINAELHDLGVEP